MKFHRICMDTHFNVPIFNIYSIYEMASRDDPERHMQLKMPMKFYLKAKVEQDSQCTLYVQT